MKNDNRPIGIFDSGLGGLTVVASLKNLMPSEDIIYLGDTARVPYGDKSPENICRFAVQDAAFLARKGVKMIIVACNTVSSIAMDKLGEKFKDIHIVGVLEAGVRACLAEKASSIAVIGTNATVKSDAYRRNIHAVNPAVKVTSILCPLFVPIVEEGLVQHPISDAAVELYLSPLKKNPPEILLLACTHYPLLQEALRKYFEGSRLKIVDSATACAKFAEEFIREKGISASEHGNGSERYFVTDMPASFLRQAKRFLGRELDSFEKVSLDTN